MKLRRGGAGESGDMLLMLGNDDGHDGADAGISAGANHYHKKIATSTMTRLTPEGNRWCKALQIPVALVLPQPCFYGRSIGILSHASARLRRCSRPSSAIMHPQQPREPNTPS